MTREYNWTIHGLETVSVIPDKPKIVTFIAPCRLAADHGHRLAVARGRPAVPGPHAGGPGRDGGA
jgi:hypothetical protein